MAFLMDGMLSNKLSNDQRKRFVLKRKPFLVIARALYRREADQFIRKCAPKEEQKVVLQEAHESSSGGHFSGEITGRKILQAGLWWPLLLKDAHTFAKECFICQRMGQPSS